MSASGLWISPPRPSTNIITTNIFIFFVHRYAAAWGKVGAFVGTWVFPLIINAAGDDSIKQGQYPFWVSSSLCIFSALIAWFGLPQVGQDMIEEEDERFKSYLLDCGYDVSSLGTREYKVNGQDTAAVVQEKA